MSFCSDLKDELLIKINKSNILAETFGEYLTIIINKNTLSSEYLKYFEISKLTENSIKSILKGSFLSNGYISDPNKDYHLEILFKSKTIAEYFIKLLSVIDFTPKILKREISKKNIYVVYIKEADQISFFLSILGASSSLIKFEEIRVEKDVKNNINRNINCEVANLSKTIKSSVTQINAIEKIKRLNKFEDLTDKLKEVVMLRENNKEESLESLAKMINISKSGLKHRLDKLVQIADEI